MLIEQWPEHVAAMRKKGVRIEMEEETLEAPVRVHNLCEVCTLRERFDVVLLLMKAYDTSWACKLIEPYLRPDGLVVAVQNGMTTDMVAQVVGPERTMGCVIEISSSMFDPGVVKRQSPPSRSWFAVGSIHPAAKSREAEVADLLRVFGAVEIVEDIRAAKWMKLVSNATTLATSAVLGLSLHEAAALPGMRELMLRSGQEAFEVGQALGYAALPIFGLTQDDLKDSGRLVEVLLDSILQGFTVSDTKTTILQDWMKGRRSEAEEINGLVVAEAMKLGRPATVNSAVMELARSIERGDLSAQPNNLTPLKAATAGLPRSDH